MHRYLIRIISGALVGCWFGLAYKQLRYQAHPSTSVDGLVPWRVVPDTLPWTLGGTVLTHRIYAGFLLAIFGTALAFGEGQNFAAFVLALLGWKTKSLGEEKRMHDHLGKNCSDYGRRAKGLIPLVW